MKEGWIEKTLGDACNIARGGSPRPIQAFLTDAADGVNWVKISDATASGKFIYVTKEKIKPSGVSRSRVVNPGDFLLSNSMSFGRPYIMQTTGCIHDGWLVLSDYEKDFNQGFLYHLLGSPVVFEQFDRLAAGSTVRNLNIELASRVSIPIPPLPEQQRIVALLDEAFDGIATAKANAEKNLQNARAIFESHLQSVFINGGANWSDTVIGKCIRFIDYRGKTPEKTSNGLKLITAKNVRMGYLKNTPEEFVAPESYDSWMTRGIPKCGDVLFTTEAPLANVAQLMTDEKVVFAQRIIVMQADAAKLDSTFLKYMLLSSPIQQRIHEKGTGATVQGIKASLLKLIEISFPDSIAEQRQIVAKLDALNAETQRLESIYQQKLTALDELKKSLLHQAFSGAL
ncbi:restriction endonuclease subunit S [Polaromonas sp.]|uniref:restriction endonuclease subunit S n=1 Tax=Polaromonas sp. TaxID=1869339 RepID=UPI0037CA0499